MKFFWVFLAISQRKSKEDEPPKNNGNNQKVILGETETGQKNNSEGICKGC